MKLTNLVSYSSSWMKKYISNVRNYDVKYAHWAFWSDLAPRIKNARLSDICQSKKKKYILHYIDQISKECPYSKLERKELGSQTKIWMFWWTGIDSAPDIVKMSVNSVKNNSNGFDVYVLDQNNYLDYITLPKYVIEKHDRGLISHAMFSDILRVSLLSTYGGIWIDATILCLRQLPEMLKTVNYYTCKAFDNNSIQVSKSRWTGYFLAGQEDFKLFCKARDILFCYWDKYDVLIEYLLLDYIFEYIRITDKDVRKAIHNLKDNNLLRNELFNRMNEPFSEELLRLFVEDETFVYKCSWRYGTLLERDGNGNMTLYGYLKKTLLG